MQIVARNRVRIMLAAYAIASAALLSCASILLPLFLQTQTARNRIFMTLYVATALCIIGGAIAYPRLAVVLCGSIACSAAFTLGVTHSFGIPIVGGYGIIFAVVYAWPSLVALSVLAYLLVIPWRRVAPQQ